MSIMFPPDFLYNLSNNLIQRCTQQTLSEMYPTVSARNVSNSMFAICPTSLFSIMPKSMYNVQCLQPALAMYPTVVVYKMTNYLLLSTSLFIIRPTACLCTFVPQCYQLFCIHNVFKRLVDDVFTILCICLRSVL